MPEIRELRADTWPVGLAWVVGPEGLTADLLGNPPVDTGGVGGVGGLEAGAGLHVKGGVEHRLGGGERSV